MFNYITSNHSTIRRHLPKITSKHSYCHSPRHSPMVVLKHSSSITKSSWGDGKQLSIASNYEAKLEHYQQL